ncbi:MAG: hypothetical protein IPN33_25665 [Saprospiraceae bacterium]|nr:hypothetical protein [Saprospiraceae bacterium]
MSSNRDRGDAVLDTATPAVQETKFWQGTNFLALTMAVGSLWGLSESDVSPLVSAVFGFVGTAFAIREKIKDAAINWGAWISSPNTWNYVFAAIAAIVPTLPAGLGDKISDIIAAIAGKNWPGLITALLAFGSILFFWFTGGKGISKLRAAK